MTTTEPNARFWAYINGGPVKITLRPGQRLSHVEGGPTDEGYSCEATTWEYADHAVYREWCHDARDCDGRLTHSGADRCDLGALRAGDVPYVLGDDPATWEGVRWPAWEKHQDHGVYDQFAQAAGY